ncbi:MAG: hypothetical protein ACOYOL_09955 [Chthoniobacterales bacterium]|jgi:hypothetical protein
MPNCVGAVLLLLLAALAAPLAAQQEIKAPFGMQWGESSDRIKQVVTKAKAKVAEERPAGGRDLMVVDGIVQEGLQRTLFYFKEGGLNEVELQYDRQDWDEVRVESWVNTIKIQADRRYGPGRVFAEETGDENGLRHSLKGWLWTQNFVSMRLIYYHAEKGDEKLRRVSLHYCAE